MKKDLPENVVEDISIAVVLENETPAEKIWNVYLVNEKGVPLKKMYSSRLKDTARRMSER